MLSNNPIVDISPLAGLTQLGSLYLDGNSITDLSLLAGLTQLIELVLEGNSIADISPLAGLTQLQSLNLGGNLIADISPLAGLTRLGGLSLNDNLIADISPLAGLPLIVLWLDGNLIADISPLVANTGLGEWTTVDVGKNPLNDASINTHIPALQSRGVTVEFDEPKTTSAKAIEFNLSVPAGISLIHVPLKVTAVDGVAQSLESITDLYNALGGASTVTTVITHDSQNQQWRSYFGASDVGTAADRMLTDDLGIMVSMIAPATIRLSGNALGTNGTSAITLNQGLNMVGLPLNDSKITRVSDLFTLDGIGGNVPVIILTANGEFQSVGRAGDPGDVPITGGQGFILNALQPATVALSGDGWTNLSGTAAAPSVTSIQAGNMTPVLALTGSIIDEGTRMSKEGLWVTVKNLSTGRTVTTVANHEKSKAGGYQVTVVDIEMGRAATIGDTLEVSVRLSNPFIGVKPVQYTVTAEDVRRSVIQLPALVAYEIPAKTELLSNYPNPFNPETWIPYRLAEDAFVSLTIYDQSGRLVRFLDVGHQSAGVYERRSNAVSWDGKNEVGETVASGVYFYHLTAGDYSATRKMLILK